MFRFEGDKEAGGRTPEQCPVCGDIGEVFAHEQLDRRVVITHYMCRKCGVTWQDPPAKGSSGCSPYNPANDDGDDSGGDLFGLTNFKGK